MKKNQNKDSMRRTIVAMIFQISICDIVLPVFAILLTVELEAYSAFIVAGLAICILFSNYRLIIRPMIKSEQILINLKTKKETYHQIGELKVGMGLERVFYHIYSQQRETVEREYSSEILRQEAELMALQSQMNPHFLYNTLESIRGYALMHGVDEIADMTEALAKLSRKMTASSSQLVTLQEEIKLVENYMTIQRFRFNNRFSLISKIEDNEVLDAKVLNLMLQPIVENAVVHGFHGKQGMYVVAINAYATGKRLVIKIQDDGVGISQDRLQEIKKKLDGTNILEQVKESKAHIGIALPNVNQRIKLYFGQEYGIDIMSTLGIGTTVEIVLPLIV